MKSSLSATKANWQLIYIADASYRENRDTYFNFKMAATISKRLNQPSLIQKSCFVDLEALRCFFTWQLPQTK